MRGRRGDLSWHRATDVSGFVHPPPPQQSPTTRPSILPGITASAQVRTYEFCGPAQGTRPARSDEPHSVRFRHPWRWHARCRSLAGRAASAPRGPEWTVRRRRHPAIRPSARRLVGEGRDPALVVARLRGRRQVDRWLRGPFADRVDAARPAKHKTAGRRASRPAVLWYAARDSTPDPAG